MKKKQIVTMVASLGLVVALGAGATLALLSAKSNVVTNTFAAGNGINADTDITLFEHDPYNDKDNDDIDTYKDGTSVSDGKKIDINGVEYQNLEPNMILKKDPTVQISKDTADCYLFVKVDNGLKGIKGISIDGIFSNGTTHWNKLEGTEDIYYYVDSRKDIEGKVISTKTSQFISEPLFENITLGMDAEIYNKDGTSKLSSTNNDIVVKAFVVQATQNNNWTEAVNLAKTNASWQ